MLNYEIPLTCNSAEYSANPARFFAIQVYIPECCSCTESIVTVPSFFPVFEIKTPSR